MSLALPKFIHELICKTHVGAGVCSGCDTWAPFGIECRRHGCLGKSFDPSPWHRKENISASRIVHPPDWEDVGLVVGGAVAGASILGIILGIAVMAL